MIPVIITAILLGTGAGALMGLFAGAFSFIVWTFTPPNPAIAFLFSPFYSLGTVQGNFFSVITCFVPRVMVGVLTGAVFFAAKKTAERGNAASVIVYGTAAALGSLANTVLTLACWWLFFYDKISELMELSGVGNFFNAIIGTTFLVNGLPEAAVSVVAGVFICMPLRRLFVKQKFI